MVDNQLDTPRQLPAKELLDALWMAREYMRGHSIEFAIINYPQKPPEALGEHLDAVLKRHGGASPSAR